MILRPPSLTVAASYEPPVSPSNRRRERNKPPRPHVFVTSPRGEECRRCAVRPDWVDAMSRCCGYDAYEHSKKAKKRPRAADTAEGLTETAKESR